MKAYKLIIASALTLSLTACSDSYMDTAETGSLTPEEAGEVAAKDADIFLNGIWSYMADVTDDHDDFNYMAALHALDMMGDDIAMGGVHFFVFDYRFEYSGGNYARVRRTWRVFYTMLTRVNEILDMFPEGAKTDDEKAIVGQCLAIRGLAYTVLPMIYQKPVKDDGSLNLDAPGVPIYLSEIDGLTLEEREALKGRNTVGKVWQQAEKDLEEAVKLLEESGYVRPSKLFIDANVANGLAARYYLYTQQWAKAETAANKARAGYAPMDQVGLHDGFMDLNNEEWMWGFDHTDNTTTMYASFFSHVSNFAPGYGGLGLSSRLIDKRLYDQIPDDDYRKSLFNGPEGDKSQSTTGAQMPYANLKFGFDGNWTMDYMYMRAAEMYLIEAEALARQGKNTEAATVLGLLMAERQPSWNKTSVTVADVQLQRSIELWCEGFSYFDKRRNNEGANRVYEGTNHLSSAQMIVPADSAVWTYQLPRSEIQENNYIDETEQNPGGEE
ncbi:MAG: RagB/SusD family nutrient uptake outer membrane protein [Bacteroidaceae bacterium]|nr:RagB/SusD family nutrient uptake outer membrane protein [Bacteroidaceae bacterium]